MCNTLLLTCMGLPALPVSVLSQHQLSFLPEDASPYFSLQSNNAAGASGSSYRLTPAF